MICMEGSRLWNPVLWCDGDVGIDVLNLPRVKPDNIELAPSGNSAFKLQWVTATQSISENHGMFIHHHPSSSIIHHHLQEILSLFGFSCHKTNISYTSLEPIKGTQRVDPIRWVPSPNCLWPCLGDFGGSSWCDMNCYEMLWFNVTLCHYVIIFIALLYALPRFKDRCQAMPKTGTKT